MHTHLPHSILGIKRKKVETGFGCKSSLTCVLEFGLYRHVLLQDTLVHEESNVNS